MSKILGPFVVVGFVVSWPFVAVEAAELGAQWHEFTATVATETPGSTGVDW